MAANFGRPVRFAFHVLRDIVVNGRRIFTDIAHAITNYRNG